MPSGPGALSSHVSRAAFRSASVNSDSKSCLSSLLSFGSPDRNLSKSCEDLVMFAFLFSDL